MTDKPDKKAIGAELVIPVAALAFTLYYFSTIVDSPWTAQVSAFFIGTVLIVLIAIFFVKSAGALRRGEATLGMDALLDPVSYLPKRLGLFALTLGFVIVVEWGGFTITTFAFMALAMLLLGDGRNKRFIAILCAVLALGGYFLFIVLFKTRFPAGPFEALMKGVF